MTPLNVGELPDPMNFFTDLGHVLIRISWRNTPVQTEFFEL